MNCSNCGHTNPPGTKFCRQCGTPMSTTTSASTAPTTSTAVGAGPPADSIQASLARLGIPLSRRQLIGFVVAVLAGMIVARILPFIYGPIFDPLLTPVFGSGAGPRDTFNSFMMTALTFAASFVISFIFAMKSQGG